MAYTPNDLRRPPVPGTAAEYATMTDNHGELYALHAPSVWEHSRPVAGFPGIGTHTLLRWRLRGNMDRHPLRTRLYCSGTSSPTIRSVVGDVTGGWSTPGAATWHTLDVTPSAGGVQDCKLEASVAGGGALELTRGLSHLAVGAASLVNRSGWVQDDGLATAGGPIAVEHVERLRNGPVQLAADRPACLFGFVSRVLPYGTALGGKYTTEWSIDNQTFASVVGRGWMPRGDRRARRYVIDAFVSRFYGSAAVVAEVQIGGWSWSIPVVDQWVSVEVELPPSPQEITASIIPGAATGAKFDCLQVWRV
jgi:hypothetical protein